MNKKQPKELWAFWANKNGPWYTTAQKVRYNEVLESWWHKDRNSDVKQIGLTHCNGYLCYASTSKEEVDQFIAGFMSCRELLKGFFV